VNDRTLREKLYRRLVRQQQVEMLIARALTKRRRNWLDKLLVAFAMRMVPQAREDFMRDPLTDNAPEFDAAALRRQRGSGGRETGAPGSGAGA
jgi:hypothetical protein